MAYFSAIVGKDLPSTNSLFEGNLVMLEAVPGRHLTFPVGWGLWTFLDKRSSVSSSSSIRRDKSEWYSLGMTARAALFCSLVAFSNSALQKVAKSSALAASTEAWTRSDTMLTLMFIEF